MDTKRKRIYDIVSQNSINNNFIYDYIISNNIRHTNNINGLFINLTRLNDSVIDDMYMYVTKVVSNINSRKNETLSITKSQSKPSAKIYKPLPVFTDIQTKILNLSKTI